MKDEASTNRADRQPAPPLFTFAWFTMWLTVLIENIARILQGMFTPNEPSLRGGTRSSGSLGASSTVSPYSQRRSLVSYINSGLNKVERARRNAAVARQFGSAMRTIKLTHRAIRSAPKPTRRLFAGYVDVLKGARDRIHSLHNELRETERHLRGYDISAIEDEIARLEPHASASADIDSTVRTRREILTAVRGFDERWTSLANQIASLSAALELNHLRIASIISVTSATGDPVRDRLDEATEQIALLEETLRELA